MVGPHPPRERSITPLERPTPKPAAPEGQTVAVDVRARVTQRVPALETSVDAATVVTRTPAPDIEAPARWGTPDFVPPEPAPRQEREPDTRVQWAPPAPSPPRAHQTGHAEAKRELIEPPTAKPQATPASLHPALTPPAPFPPEALADTFVKEPEDRPPSRNELTRVRPEPLAGAEAISTRRVPRRLSDRQLFWAMVALGAGVGTSLVVTFYVAFTWRDARAPAPAAVVYVAEPHRAPPVAPEQPAAVAKTGTVRIITEPEAHVRVDGRDLGPQPVTVELPVGPATLVLENAKLGLKRTVSIDVAPNDQNVERYVFPKGWIEIDAPATSKVAVDGKTVAKRTVQVFEGAHRVEVTHADKRRTRAVQAANVVGGVTTTIYFEPPSIADE